MISFEISTENAHYFIFFHGIVLFCWMCCWGFTCPCGFAIHRAINCGSLTRADSISAFILLADIRIHREKWINWPPPI